jgi:hypothetical protein
MDTEPCLTFDRLALGREVARRRLAMYVMGLLPAREDWEIFVRLQEDHEFADFALEVEHYVLHRSLRHRLRILSAKVMRPIRHALIDRAEALSGLAAELRGKLEGVFSPTRVKSARDLDNCFANLCLPSLAGNLAGLPDHIEVDSPSGEQFTLTRKSLADGDVYETCFNLGIADASSLDLVDRRVVASLGGIRSQEAKIAVDGVFVVAVLRFPASAFKDNDLTFTPADIYLEPFEPVS